MKMQIKYQFSRHKRMITSVDRMICRAFMYIQEVFEMDLRKLKTLIDLVAESGISELEVTEENDKVRIVNKVQTVAVAAPVAAPVVAAPAPAPAAPAAQPQAAAEEPAVEGTTVTSPMVGTFYRAPNPGAEPFVKVGDHVEAGQTLGIIEAMKLLNEIEAETSGTIKEICVENAQPVEFGQPLFIIG